MKRAPPLLVILSLAVASCTVGASQRAASVGARRTPGGALRVGLVDWPAHEAFFTVGPATYMFDPAADSERGPLELFRCCLLRTMMVWDPSGEDHPGSGLRPDLAAAPSAISADGLTWTSSP